MRIRIFEVIRPPKAVSRVSPILFYFIEQDSSFTGPDQIAVLLAGNCNHNYLIYKK